eukprot:5458956-Pleurochrysis_carterae.AAC.2
MLSSSGLAEFGMRCRVGQEEARADGGAEAERFGSVRGVMAWGQGVETHRSASTQRVVGCLAQASLLSFPFSSLVSLPGWLARSFLPLSLDAFRPRFQ